jgi:hypothetical protein
MSIAYEFVLRSNLAYIMVLGTYKLQNWLLYDYPRYRYDRL